MSKRILMEGYYGRGNFGDDVLMHVTYHLLRQQLPQAQITIVIGDEQYDYPRHMLEGVISEPPNRHAQFDLIVHGGGGVFFDFKSYSLLHRLGEILIRMIGFKRFVAAEKWIRALSRKPRVSGTNRIGLGIGIGTFTPGSPRMLRSLPILAECDALWLRDTQSANNLERFAPILRAEIVQGSDLAFLTDYWMPAIAEPSISSGKPKLGIALRDWPDTDIHALRNSLTKLSKHYDITGFIFDEKTDPLMQSVLAAFPIHIWQPASMTIASFAAAIAAQNVLLTSRAHGAICGACLGVPSVIIPIEPKLMEVHSMLPNSTVTCDLKGDLSAAINTARSIHRDTIAQDVARNRASSHTALQTIKRWLT